MGAYVHYLVQYSQTNGKKVNLDWCLFSNPVPQNEFWEKSAEVFILPVSLVAFQILKFIYYKKMIDVFKLSFRCFIKY